MPDDQTKRFFFISFFEPFFCGIFYQICDISFFTGPASVGKDKIRIEIMSLTDKNFEKIKTQWAIPQMIFADPDGLVPCFLQSISKLEITGDVVGSGIIFKDVDLAVFYSQAGRTSWSVN